MLHEESRQIIIILRVDFPVQFKLLFIPEHIAVSAVIALINDAADEHC